MKRKEQIEKEAFNYINSDAVSPENMQLAFGDFINGAKWVDKTMLDKACEWLKKHYAPAGFVEGIFRKAMED